MKRLLILGVVSFVLVTSPLWQTYAQETKNCPCGYDGIDCIPCEEEDVKPVPKMKEKDAPSCRCGYDADGSCIPCKDSDYDKREREE